MAVAQHPTLKELKEKRRDLAELKRRLDTGEYGNRDRLLRHMHKLEGQIQRRELRWNRIRDAGQDL